MAKVILQSIGSERAEFLLISLWDSYEAIRRFAGEDVDRAVFYPEDERFLIERDEHVDHFDVVQTVGRLTPRGFVHVRLP